MPIRKKKKKCARNAYKCRDQTDETRFGPLSVLSIRKLSTPGISATPTLKAVTYSMWPGQPLVIRSKRFYSSSVSVSVSVSLSESTSPSVSLPSLESSSRALRFFVAPGASPDLSERIWPAMVSANIVSYAVFA